jgi:tetratricopeptide (TPR) repeat protein
MLVIIGLIMGTSIAYLKSVLDSRGLEKINAEFVAKPEWFKRGEDVLLRSFFLTADKIYLLDSGRTEKKLAQIYYDAYLKNWSDIRREKTVQFDSIPLTVKTYTLLVFSHLTGKKNRSAMYEFVEGFNRLNKKMFDPATQNFERVFHAEIPQLDKIALLYYGYCKQQTKDYKNALEKYHRLERISGEWIPELFYNLAVIYEKQGDLQKFQAYQQKFEKTRQYKLKEK